MGQALGSFGRAGDGHSARVQRGAAVQSRLAALAESEERLAADRAEADSQLAAARDELAGLADPTSSRETLTHQRAALGQRRGVHLAPQGEHDRLLPKAAPPRPPPPTL